MSLVKVAGAVNGRITNCFGNKKVGLHNISNIESIYTQRGQFSLMAASTTKVTQAAHHHTHVHTE